MSKPTITKIEDGYVFVNDQGHATHLADRCPWNCNIIGLMPARVAKELLKQIVDDGQRLTPFAAAFCNNYWHRIAS